MLFSILSTALFVPVFSIFLASSGSIPSSESSASSSSSSSEGDVEADESSLVCVGLACSVPSVSGATVRAVLLLVSISSSCIAGGGYLLRSCSFVRLLLLRAMMRCGRVSFVKCECCRRFEDL